MNDKNDEWLKLLMTKRANDKNNEWQIGNNDKKSKWQKKIKKRIGNQKEQLTIRKGHKMRKQNSEWLKGLMTMLP